MDSKNRVLVVDDDEDMRAALSEALARLGLSTETATDGEDGLRKVEADRFDLVISDIKMPNMGGIELLAKIKEVSPELPVIMMTAYGSVETSVEAIRAGASDYILKPFSSDILENSISRILSEKGGQLNRVQPVKRISATRSGNSRPIIAKSPKIFALLDIVDRTANSNASFLIQGESGTGKELFARLIHEKSGRTGPFVAVNCAALPESLLESELFGHEKGSFTGAIARKTGKFELAEKGTILLDEITEMQTELQAKLLRVLQEKEIDRVGGAAPVPIDVRVVATTNRNIEGAIAEGKFREDLYFRLNVIPLVIPPLRERPDDLELLVNNFTEKFSAESGKKVTGVSPETMELFKKFRWRGNVRELENVMERAVLLCRGETIMPDDLFLTPEQAESPAQEPEAEKKQSEDVSTGTLDAMEKRLILGTLENVNNNRTRAAELLGISIRTLRNKLNEYKNTMDAA